MMRHVVVPSPCANHRPRTRLPIFNSIQGHDLRPRPHAPVYLRTALARSTRLPTQAACCVIAGHHFTTSCMAACRSRCPRVRQHANRCRSTQRPRSLLACFMVGVSCFQQRCVPPAYFSSLRCACRSTRIVLLCTQSADLHVDVRTASRDDSKCGVAPAQRNTFIADKLAHNPAARGSPAKCVR